jgi:hypothetical protein
MSFAAPTTATFWLGHSRDYLWERFRRREKQFSLMPACSSALVRYRTVHRRRPVRFTYASPKKKVDLTPRYEKEGLAGQLT